MRRFAFALMAFALASCGSPESSSAPPDVTATIPPGKQGAMVTRGKTAPVTTSGCAIA
jgi:hypothetical protein